MTFYHLVGVRKKIERKEDMVFKDFIYTQPSFLSLPN